LADKVPVDPKYNKIKEELLKSGLPLESVVLRSLLFLSPELTQPLLYHGEFFYKRSETELPGSLDLLFTYDMDLKECDFIQLVFLIECKYRTRGTTWFFTPNQIGDPGMEFFIENFFNKGKCTRKTFPSMAPPLGRAVSLVDKGVEIYSDGNRNEESIKKGLHQLMFGAASLLRRAFFKTEGLVETMDDRKINIRGRPLHTLICPLLVTTAGLRVLTEPSIETIEKSKNPDEVSKIEELVVLTNYPPLYLREYVTNEVLKDALSFSEMTPADTRSAKSFLMESSMFHPSRYYVIDIHSLLSFIPEYLTFIESLLRIGHKQKL
jgi:hypothetical protein